MLSIIRQAKSVSEAVRYNERKVADGAARFLKEQNIPGVRSLDEKIQYMQQGAWCAHIAVTFDPNDQLGPAALAGLAWQYMERIGQGEDPYLVYQHMDTFHPHLHIVSAPAEGCLDRSLETLSRKVTRRLEREYDLVRTQPVYPKNHPYTPQNAPDHNPLEDEPAFPALYGRELMGRAIYRTLRRVLEHYQFTSLEAYNALLHLYNVKADRGRPGSRIYENRGLVYRLLDPRGKSIGMGIKASRLPGQPTLAFIERRCEEALAEEETVARFIRVQADWILREGTPLMPVFQERMLNAGIQLLWNDDQLVYLDHRSRWAIKAETLGPDYTASALQERCHAERKDLILCRSMSRTADWPSQAR